MSRLPIPGGDSGNWGVILNDYLSVSLGSDGSIQPQAIHAAGAEMVSNKGQVSGYASLNTNGLVPTSQLGSGTANSSTYLRGDGSWATTGGGGAVSSVFGRTGAVTAQSGDYTASQVTGALVNTNNLSDVNNASTSFSNIKQSATLGTTGVIQLTGDLGNSATSPQVVSTHLASALPVNQGGTGQTTQQAAMNALAGATTSGQYLRGNNTNVVMSAIQAGDLPSGTSSVKGALQLDGTASDILGSGTQAAGSNGLAADSGHVHPSGDNIPADLGLLAWTFPIDGAITDFLLVAGTIYLSKIPIRVSMTATYLWFSCGGSGSGASSGSYVGLYNSSGTLLTGSADLGSNIVTGSHQVTLTTPQSLTAGSFVWAAIVTNLATTQPSPRSIYNFSGSSTPNLNLTAATYRAAIPSGGTGQTSLLGSFTPSSNTITGSCFMWFGIS